MKYLIALLLLIVGFKPLFAGNDSTALILVDIQEFYFPEGFSPLEEPEKASAKAADLLNHFRESDMLVVHVRHIIKKDSAIHEYVKPRAEEKVVRKNYANSFKETDLQEILSANDIKQLIVVGMMTHMCVEATSRHASDLGYQVIVASDACTTRDLTFKGDTIKARDVHLSTLASIDRYYGQVMTVEEILEEF